jgi:2-haloacid dehalogenase
MLLTDFKVLTFDCYGTLIDWESGIWNALQPLLVAGGLTLGRDAALEAFAARESAQEATTPDTLYSDLLMRVHAQLAEDWGVDASPEMHARFGASVPDWPAFPDSVAALQYLKQHYKLVILSNVHRAGFAASNERLQVDFDAVYTAQDIGSYKPTPRNFEYLLAHLKADLGLEKSDILHTAQSLFHKTAGAPPCHRRARCRSISISPAWPTWPRRTERRSAPKSDLGSGLRHVAAHHKSPRRQGERPVGPIPEQALPEICFERVPVFWRQG